MSAPFRFGLQRVRDIRAHDEDQAKERFAASLTQRAKGEAMLRAADERLSGARSGSVADTLGPLSGPALVSRQVWLDRLSRSRDQAAAQLTGLDQALQLSRASLTDASRAREVLDKLKTRHRETHRLEAERREGAELDEMALQVHARRQAA